MGPEYLSQPRALTVVEEPWDCQRPETSCFRYTSLNHTSCWKHLVLFCSMHGQMGAHWHSHHPNICHFSVVSLRSSWDIWHPVLREKKKVKSLLYLGVVVCTHNPSTREMETERYLDLLASQSSQTYELQVQWETVSNHKLERYWRKTPSIGLWFLMHRHICASVHTYMNTYTHTLY